jgi:hypothetical protein
MPAYNSERTLLQTHKQIDRSIFDEIVVGDAGSELVVISQAPSAWTLRVHLLGNKNIRGYGRSL